MSSFGWVFNQKGDYLSLLHLGGEAESVIERLGESARSCTDLVSEVRDLLEKGWRGALVACAALHGACTLEALDLLWEALDQGSWVAPQIAITLWMLDPRFEERARQRLLSGCPVQPEPDRNDVSRPEVHVVHGPAGPRTLSAKTRVSLMSVLAHDQAGREWLRLHVDRAEALRDVLVEDAWDGSGRIVSQWAATLAACLKVEGLRVAGDVLLQVWTHETPEWLRRGQLLEGFLEPMLRAGVSEFEWLPDEQGDLVRAEPVGQLRFDKPDDALLRWHLDRQAWNNRILTSRGVLEVSSEPLRLKLGPPLPIALSRARLEDSRAEVLVYGNTSDAAVLAELAGPAWEAELRERLAEGQSELGRGVCTRPYGLAEKGVKLVGHIVAFDSPDGCSEPGWLGDGLAHILREAEAQGLTEVAVACMATGVGGADPFAVAGSLVGTARRYFLDQPQSQLRLTFCLPDETDYKAFERFLERGYAHE